MNTRPGTSELPLWSDIAKAIFNNLYPRDSSSAQNQEYGGELSADRALRLAQEYKTAFGRTDLHRLLGQLVPDSHFRPGDAHLRLLHLPWRDVFTTNWDTLLEHASEAIAQRGYSVVQDMDQIPLMGQPRIVKLHGSFPSNYPLIVTEEDYRTYPTKFAPFVNTVQQAMMETIFLLIGFSGEDPNFLSWSGWVRDNLGDAAPKIYLAGWLDLSHHRRRMLEDRGVVPIDLAHHSRAQSWPEDQRHQYAIEWLLYSLEAGRPYDETMWPSLAQERKISIPEHLEPVVQIDTDLPQTHPDTERNTASPLYGNESVDRIQQVLKSWAHNRSIYPGWLILPAGEQRSELSRRTNEWEPPILTALPNLTPIERLRALRELVWRREILLEPITVGFEAAAIGVLHSINSETRTIEGIEVPRDDWSEIRDAWRIVALALLTDARLEGKEDVFQERLEALTPYLNDSTEVEHRIHHERCLWAMFSLDIAVLNDLLDAWPIENCDPAWMLRKAALLTEVGRHDESMTLVQDALNSIRKDLSGYKNIASASREGWALASKLTLDNKQEVFARWDELTSLKCDAWMEIDYLARAMTGTEQQKKAPSFDLGSRRGARIRISNERRDRVMAAYRAVRLPEVAGLPPVNRSATGVPNVAAYRILALAADEIVSVNPNLAMRLALRICTYDRDEMLQRVLSRTRVATLSDESAKTLAEVCIGVIEYILPRLPTLGSHRSEFSWIERMQVAMEALSRLVLRLSPEMATTAFDVGLVCYQTPQVVQHSLLVSSLGSVLKRSWQAIPSKLRVKYALTALRLPIAGADGFVAGSDLVDPAEFVGIDDLPTERTTHHEGSYRELVSHLARALNQNDEARERATLRLLLLASKQCLTNDELVEIAEALWSKQDPIRNNTRGPNSPWDWVYLILPQLEYGQAEKSFRGKWLGGGSSEAVESSHSSERLAQVGYAIEGLHSNDSPLLLSTEERDLLLNGIVEIVEMLSSTSVSFDTSIESAIRGIRSIGAEITIPSEIAEHLFARVEILLSTENEPEDAWFQPVYDVRIAIGFALVPGLVKALPDRVDTIALLLRRALASDDDLLVGRAMSVLQYWLSESNWTPGTILDDLVKEVGAIIASRRRVALVDALLCATYVFDRGTLSYQETIRQLVLDGLSYLAEELRYDRDHGDSDEVPTLRLLCVRLARHMARHGLEDNPTVSKWLDIGRNDPFPEIRMAVTDG